MRRQDVDEVAVERALTGEPLRLTIPEREEAVRRLCGRGLSDQLLAERLHVNIRTIVRIRLRLGLPANVDNNNQPTGRAV